MEDFPPELVLYIFNFLNFWSLIQASMVCRRWREAFRRVNELYIPSSYDVLPQSVVEKSYGSHVKKLSFNKFFSWEQKSTKFFFSASEYMDKITKMCPELVSLDLSGIPILPDLIPDLFVLRRLRHLTFSTETKVDMSHMNSLINGFKGLISLRCVIGDDFSVDDLNLHSSLISLAIRQKITYPDKIDLSNLKTKFPSLNILEVESMRLTGLPEGLDTLKIFCMRNSLRKSLKSCRVVMLNIATDMVLDSFGPNLKDLTIFDGEKISDRGLEFLEKYQSLSRVCLEYFYLISDQGMSVFSTLPMLSKLDIVFFKKLTDQGLRYIPTSCETFIKWCDNITPEALTILPNATYNGCRQLTPDGNKILDYIQWVSTIDT